MVDLEWGLSPSEREHGAIDSEFRAKELQRCHDVSVGPSFVVSCMYLKCEELFFLENSIKLIKLFTQSYSG